MVLFAPNADSEPSAAYPTLRELLGDAWLELSGWDGRFARTLRTLLRDPGALTVETLIGRRVRYITPVPLYLITSVVYFLIAALAPNVRPPSAVSGGDLRTRRVAYAYEGGW